MISWPELNDAMSMLEEAWTPRRQAILLVKTDVNMDGNVDFNEFTCWQTATGRIPNLPSVTFKPDGASLMLLSRWVAQ